MKIGYGYVNGRIAYGEKMDFKIKASSFLVNKKL
jgi:hypothetical protein